MAIHRSRNLRKTRIAYVFNHAFFLGGGEVSFFELIRTIDRSQFDPIKIVPESGYIERLFTKNGDKVFVTPFPPLRHIAFCKPVSAVLKLIKTLRTAHIDIIHANGSRACLYVGLAGHLLGIPVIWHVRESLRDLSLYDRCLSLLSTAIICVSNSTKIKRFGRFGSHIGNKIHVVHNGIDTTKFQMNGRSRDKIRKNLSVGKNEVLFAIVGNLIPRKGQDFFLKGLAKASRIKPDLKVKVLFIGRSLDLHYKEMLHRYVLEKDLGDTVIFQDYAEEVLEILSALDVFVLPSTSEGFSRSLLEAMSVSLPVLGSKIHEIEEAIPDEQYGLLVELNDVKEMASAIIKLSENIKLRNSMGEWNRRRAVQYFDLKSHARDIETIYENTLGKIRGSQIEPSWSTS